MAFAINDFGVTTPTTVLQTTKTYHGISIQTRDGNVVGRIQGWTPTYASREGIHLYELNAQTWGRPIDYVPGKESGRQITCTRAEVWDQEIETVFGESVDQGFQPVGLSATNPTIEWRDLCDQTQPFEVREVWQRGLNNYKVWTYRGCWFTEISKDEHAAEGDAVVRVSVTMNYVIRHLTT